MSFKNPDKLKKKKPKGKRTTPPVKTDTETAVAKGQEKKPAKRS